MDGLSRYSRYLYWIALVAMVLPVCAADPAEDQFIVAARQYSQGRWQLAADEFREFLRRYPQHERAADAKFFLAESLSQDGQLDEAQKILASFLNHHASHVYAARAHYRLGELAHFSRRDDVAIPHLEAFLKVAPRDPLAARAWLYLAEAEALRGRAQAAEERYQRVLREFPQAAEATYARLGLADIAAERGQAPVAIGFLQYVIGQGNAESARAARVRLARIWEQKDELEKAAAEWQKVLGDSEAAAWHLEGTVAIARIRATQNRWEDVVRLLKSHRDITQGEWASTIHGLLAAAADEQDDRESLQRELSVLRERWPRSPWTEEVLWRWLRRMDESRSDLSRGLSLAQAFLDSFPDSDRASRVRKLRLAWLLARGEFERTVELAGQEVEEQLTKVSAQLAAGRAEEALETLDSIRPETEANSELASIADGLRGLGLASTERYAEAIEYLETAMERRPRFLNAARVRRSLMLAYAKTRQWEKAEQLRQTWLESDARAATERIYQGAVLRLADELALAGEDERAAGLYRELSASEDGQVAAAALAGQAWSAFRNRSSGRSAEIFGRLIERYPEHPLAAEAAWMRGRALEQDGNFDGALAMYRLVIERYPRSDCVPKAMLDAARLHRRLKQTPEAVAVLQRLIRQYPADDLVPAAWYELAWNHRDAGDMDASRTAFATIHDRYTESRLWADATYRLASAATESGEFERAEQYLAALTRKRDRAEAIWGHAWFLRGQLAGRNGDWAACRQAMQNVLTSDPRDELRLAALFWKAESSFRRLNWEDAQREFDDLAERLKESPAPPWKAKVDLRRAQIAAHREEWNLALEMVERYRSEYGDAGEGEEINYLEGRCHLGRGQFDKARQAWRRVIDSGTRPRSETAAMAQWMTGESYFIQKRYDEAIRAYLRVEALYRYPKWQAAGLLQAGKCYEAQGQWERAVRLYRQLLDHYPDNPHREEAERRWRVARQRSVESSLR